MFTLLGLLVVTNMIKSFVITIRIPHTRLFVFLVSSFIALQAVANINAAAHQKQEELATREIIISNLGNIPSPQVLQHIRTTENLERSLSNEDILYILRGDFRDIFMRHSPRTP